MHGGQDARRIRRTADKTHGGQDTRRIRCMADKMHGGQDAVSKISDQIFKVQHTRCPAGQDATSTDIGLLYRNLSSSLTCMRKVYAEHDTLTLTIRSVQ